MAATTFLFASKPPVVARASSNYSEITTYPNPTPHIGDEFGSAVAWMPDGSQLVVAARSYNFGGSNPAGAVFILNRDTGTVLHRLQKAAPASNDYFGYSIAVSGTQVLVGAQKDAASGKTTAGAAYLFDAGSGSLVQTFTATAGAKNDLFGSSVAFLTDTVLIGDPQFGSPIRVGRVYICLVVDGSCPTPIDSPTQSDGGYFGLAVASLGTDFAVGAPLDGDHGTVYVFSSATDLVLHTIAPTSTFTADNFGHALATVGGNILIGAPNDGTGASNAGAAYLYQPDGTLLHKFINPGPHANDRFGSSVAGAGSFVLIGAPGDNQGAGIAYLFDAGTGNLVNQFQKASPHLGDEFGAAVALQPDNALVGAHFDNLGAASAGAVYRFSLQMAWTVFMPLIARH